MLLNGILQRKNKTNAPNINFDALETEIEQLLLTSLKYEVYRIKITKFWKDVLHQIYDIREYSEKVHFSLKNVTIDVMEENSIHESLFSYYSGNPWKFKSSTLNKNQFSAEKNNVWNLSLIGTQKPTLMDHTFASDASYRVTEQTSLVLNNWKNLMIFKTIIMACEVKNNVFNEWDIWSTVKARTNSVRI